MHRAPETILQDLKVKLSAFRLASLQIPTRVRCAKPDYPDKDVRFAVSAVAYTVAALSAKWSTQAHCRPASSFGAKAGFKIFHITSWGD